MFQWFQYSHPLATGKVVGAVGDGGGEIEFSLRHLLTPQVTVSRVMRLEISTSLIRLFIGYQSQHSERSQPPEAYVLKSLKSLRFLNALILCLPSQ